MLAWTAFLLAALLPRNEAIEKAGALIHIPIGVGRRHRFQRIQGLFQPLGGFIRGIRRVGYWGRLHKLSPFRIRISLHGDRLRLRRLALSGLLVGMRPLRLAFFGLVYGHVAE